MKAEKPKKHEDKGYHKQLIKVLAKKSDKDLPTEEEETITGPFEVVHQVHKTSRLLIDS